MKWGEFAHALVQDKRNKHVIIIQDNQHALTVTRLSSDNQDNIATIINLLSGGKSDE